MERKLTFAVCSFIYPEVSEVIKNGDYPDVNLIQYPASCSGNYASLEIIDGIIKNNINKSSEIVVLKNSCIPVSNQLSLNGKINYISLEQCFEPFLCVETITHFIKKGYYLVTSGWLKKIEEHKKNWGFSDIKAARTFFQESMKKILFLDTLIPGEYQKKLENLAEYMGLDYQVLPIGTSHCKMYVDSLIFEWRNENEKKLLNQNIARITQRTADYSVLFRHLETLVSITDEKKIIELAMQLSIILFSPKKVGYTQKINQKSVKFEKDGLMFSDEIPGESFSVEISYNEEKLGVLEIFDVRFLNYLEQYKAMGKTIAQILGIAIANARRYNVIIEQKNQIELYSNELKKSNQTKDKLFSVIAHDLRSPFNSIIGFSEILQESADTGNLNDVKQFSTIIYENSQRAYVLLINLLEWAHSQLNKIEVSLQNENISSIVKEVTQLLQMQVEQKRIALKLDIDNQHTAIADKNMLTTIIRNLISNAIKYTRENGEICVFTAKNKEGITISIKDNGIGMPPEVASKLLTGDVVQSKPGTQGEKGTGLGLMLCKEFTETMGGKIWVESEISKGSTFFVQLKA